MPYTAVAVLFQAARLTVLYHIPWDMTQAAETLSDAFRHRIAFPWNAEA